MFDFLLWYLFLLALGWLSFPIAYRLMPNLADRGFALARPLGLLIWGYIFWLLASLQFVRNDAGGMLLALLFVAGLSALSLKGRWREFVDWLADHKRVILTVEVLFLIGFAFWTYVRAGNPDISGTEKPMEMAFINAILRSPTFPPRDPWLAGYSISYYYFGYVMIAMLVRMTGVEPGVAFNLASALWFALTAAAAYGIVFNLLASRHRQRPMKAATQIGGALLGPLFVLLLGNLEGMLEVFHSGGLFWRQTADGGWQSRFWSWLDLQELVNPPSPPFTWRPERPGGIWWWRASRVLQDYDLAGGSKEVIDEFPFFSYLLADLHPHVLAMPFVLLAVGLALQFFLRPEGFQFGGESLVSWFGRWARGEEVYLRHLALYQWLRQGEFWLVVLVMGGLAFLNTWDFPIYVGLYAAIVALKRMQREGWHAGLLSLFMRIGITVGLLGVLLYLPFYSGFASQAGGFLPSMAFFTRGVHFWVMFGTLLIPIVFYLIWLWWTAGNRQQLMKGLKFALLLVGGLWVFSFLAAGMMVWLPDIIPDSARLNSGASFLLSLQGAGDAFTLLFGSLVRRLAQPGTWITLIGLLTLVWSLVGVFTEAKPKTGRDDKRKLTTADGFVLALLFVGAGLVLFPEFMYLRDQFSTRMNTIFKFYFQAWILWAIAAAYGSVVLWGELKKLQKGLYAVVWSMVLISALAYPVFGLLSQTRNFGFTNLSLDGTRFISYYASDDLAAIQWLRQAPDGVIVEAVGGSYSGYARIATHTGLPNLLGWPGHESQWRGGAEEMGSRQVEIETVYQTNRWEEAKPILERYQVRYVVVGNLERSTYRVSEAKFTQHLRPVFTQGNIVIFEVPGAATSSDQSNQLR